MIDSKTPEEFAAVILENQLTPDELIVMLIKETAPYIPALEKAIAEVQFGEMDVKFLIRAGSVESMKFWIGKAWLRDKPTS